MSTRPSTEELKYWRELSNINKGWGFNERWGNRAGRLLDEIEYLEGELEGFRLALIEQKDSYQKDLHSAVDQVQEILMEKKELELEHSEALRLLSCAVYETNTMTILLSDEILDFLKRGSDGGE